MPQPWLPVNVMKADSVPALKEAAEKREDPHFSASPLYVRRIVLSEVPDMYVLGCHRLSFKYKQCLKGHLGIGNYLFFIIKGVHKECLFLYGQFFGDTL